MSHHLSCRISDSLWSALRAEAERTGDSVSHVVQRALSDALDLEHHSIFQLSTSGAIVNGVFQGCATVGDLKSHGDLGIGTFEDLDGELVLAGGRCFQAGVDGVTTEVADDQRVPFATVTRFRADRTTRLTGIETIDGLYERLDGLRPSENVFVALQLDGLFERVDLRAARKALPGEDLVTATSRQSEFGFDDIEGTLVGFWTPSYAKAVGVAGYHLHFISADRRFGGHLIDVRAAELSVGLHLETDIHVAIPETEAFLRADLSDDPSPAMEIAERGFVHDR